MKLLFIEACPRPVGVSRTRGLAAGFVKALQTAWPDVEIFHHDVEKMHMLPLDGVALARRERLIDARAWDDRLFAPARAFVQADAILVAAPYWDLMFPAMLKTYIEHVFIRELTFFYREDRPIGLCAADRAVFLTTAGSPMGALDYGVRYLRDTLAMLGIRRFDSVAAQGLDLQGADANAILLEAEAKAKALARIFFDGPA